MPTTADPVPAFSRAMQESRRAGVPFEQAWRSALPRASAAREVLEATREAWEAAYTGGPPQRSHLAAAALAGALTHEAEHQARRHDRLLG